MKADLAIGQVLLNGRKMNVGKRTRQMAQMNYDLKRNSIERLWVAYSESPPSELVEFDALDYVEFFEPETVSTKTSDNNQHETSFFELGFWLHEQGDALMNLLQKYHKGTDGVLCFKVEQSAQSAYLAGTAELSNWEMRGNDNAIPLTRRVIKNPSSAPPQRPLVSMSLAIDGHILMVAKGDRLF